MALLITAAIPAVDAQARPVAESHQQVSDLFTGCCAGRYPSVSDGRGYVVFWPVDSRIVARRVDPSGRPQGAVATVHDSAFWTTPASDGVSIIAFSTRTPEGVIEAQVLSSDLQRIGAPVAVRRGFALAAIFDGVDYVLVSAESNESTKSSEMWLSRVTRDGRLVTSRRVEVDPPAFGGGSSIAFNGAEFVVAWQETVPVDCGPFPCIVPTRLRVISFDARLELTALKGQVVADGGSFPSVVWTGSRFVLNWTDLQDVFAQTIDAGVLGARQVILDIPDTIILGVSAVWDGRNVMVLSYRAFSNGELYAVRLDRDGRSVDPPAGVQVASGLGYVSGILLREGFEGRSLLTYLRGAEPGTYGVFSSLIRNEAGQSVRRAVRR